MNIYKEEEKNPFNLIYILSQNDAVSRFKEWFSQAKLVNLSLRIKSDQATGN